jgi:hypothetical protein
LKELGELRRNVSIGKLPAAMGDGPAFANQDLNAKAGGLNLIFSGDLCQKKPPQSKTVYDEPTLANPMMVNGAQLWKDMQYSVELWLNKRCDEDELWAAFLADVRLGNCVLPHKDYVNARALPNLTLSPEEKATLPMAVMGTTRNVVRQLLNNEQVQWFGRQVRRRCVVVTAADSCRTSPIIPFDVRRQLLALPDSGLTSYLPGHLLLVPGVPITLKSNLLPSSFLFNSSQGTFVSMVLHPDEPPYVDDYREPPHFLRFMPVSISVCIRDATHEKPFAFDVSPTTDLPTANLVISPASVALKIRQYKKGDHCYQRKQFPIVSGRAYTDYNLQSDTIEEPYLVDVERHKGQTDFTTALYVLFSRVRRLAYLYLTMPLRLFDLQGKPNKVLLDELDRLSQLDRTTRRHFAADFKEAFPDYVAPETDPYYPAEFRASSVVPFVDQYREHLRKQGKPWPYLPADLVVPGQPVDRPRARRDPARTRVPSRRRAPDPTHGTSPPKSALWQQSLQTRNTLYSLPHRFR